MTKCIDLYIVQLIFLLFRKTELVSNDEIWGLITKIPDFCLLLKNQNLIVPSPLAGYTIKELEQSSTALLAVHSFLVPTWDPHPTYSTHLHQLWSEGYRQHFITPGNKVTI